MSVEQVVFIIAGAVCIVGAVIAATHRDPRVTGISLTATLLALPTMMDTAPNVLAEARAAGVPVVASAVGGIPELIEHGVDGLLVPAGKPGA